MKTKLNLFAVSFVLAIFMIAGCGEEQKEIIAPITQEDDVSLKVACTSDSPSNEGIIPTLEAGNPDLCTGGKRIDPPNSGTYDLDSYGNQVTVTVTTSPCGQVFSWSVPDNIVIDQVVAKGGPNANIYDYTGKSLTSDADLHCPLNSGSGQYYDISHIDFCFHYKLSVSKTANTEYTRTYKWNINKVGNVSDLILAVGQTYTANYNVTTTATYIDSDWRVTGKIIVANMTPYDAVITSISDVISGNIAATSDCGLAFPYTLTKGATLICTYVAEPGAATNGTNTVTVVTSTAMVEGGTATADYTFGIPSTEIDECIVVTDDQFGLLGTACASTSPTTFSYLMNIGPYNACGEYTFTNLASFVTNDSQATGSDDHTVSIVVPCVGGCTLTQGYWKTHSKYGPAPYDDTWNGMEDVPFFLSGQSYYQVLWTPPAGNVYYILAQQYIAAQLNALNGADFSAAQAAFDAATILLSTYTPAQAAALRGNAKKPWTDLATILDNYNNGLIGPGHCDE